MIILRDNGVVNSILQALGIDERADHPAQHGLRGHPRHDLRLPAVRDPAAVRVDRPARRRARRGRARPVRERPRRVPARHPAADDAGHHRRGAPDVHPGHRRLRHAGPARRAQQTTIAKVVQDAVPRRSRLAVRGGPRVHPDRGHDRRDVRRAPQPADARSCPDEPRAEPAPDRLCARRLRLPVPAHRRPDHLLVQRRPAELQLGTGSRSTGIRRCSGTS